eukprot:Seg974.4 transcript_id=Seg974.4/GoldUCD/mRNA.D3Y31 product="hypothetical protein" pseudo=true protein_id=Seg974.4/GoldUCD/D3Y31
MKWMVERDDRRREEDRIRDKAIMKMVEAISRQQSETTQDIWTAERVRQETRLEERSCVASRRGKKGNMICGKKG